MIIEKIDTHYSAFELFHAFKDDPYCFILDSSLQNKRLGQYTFMGSNPFAIFKSKGESITVIENGIAKNLQGNPFDKLSDMLRQYRVKDTHDIPFLGGAVGYLGYDMAHHIEKLPRRAIDDINIPDCFFGFYDSLIAVDHLDNSIYLVAAGLKNNPSKMIEMLKSKVEGISRDKLHKTQPIPCGEIVSNFAKEDYINAVESVRSYIRSGDIYQANMTQRFKCRTEEAPFSLYSRLRDLNPAPFACYMDFGDGHILSSSPERFIRIKDSVIETRPIKGTRPRGKTSKEDEANKAELLSSEKDKSELLMIVDLERNDLGKICKTGTVKVPELFYLEEYATVHHLVSTIVGEVREDVDPVEAIKAAFPGGSITGAPKIRAMEVIDELEPTQRNIYTGSIGYIGFNGEVDLNIAIRTITMKEGMAYFQAGGGIVWDSEPELEYQETLHKARALFKALRNEQ